MVHISSCFPNDIWPQITSYLHVKSFYALSKTCSFFNPICQPYLKVTEVFFDMFNELLSEYCVKRISYEAIWLDTNSLQRKVIYSRINRSDIDVVKKNLDKRAFCKTNLSFYPSLLSRLSDICMHLKVAPDNLTVDCGKLINTIQFGDFRRFEKHLKFVPMGELRKLALENNFYGVWASINLFDQIKQSDFVMIPVLEDVIECDDVAEPLKSTCVGANDFRYDEEGIIKAVYYYAKIQKINIIFQTEFCQTEILDALEIVNKQLRKEFPFN